MKFQELMLLNSSLGGSTNRGNTGRTSSRSRLLRWNGYDVAIFCSHILSEILSTTERRHLEEILQHSQRSD
jgi:hypothetical protein